MNERNPFGSWAQSHQQSTAPHYWNTSDEQHRMHQHNTQVLEAENKRLAEAVRVLGELVLDGEAQNRKHSMLYTLGELRTLFGLNESLYRPETN